MITKLFAFLFFIVGLCSAVLDKPHSLRCEHLYNPVGIDIEKPRFSWILPNFGDRESRGSSQKAYEIVVNEINHNNEEKKVWDTGKVASSQTFLVEYSSSTHLKSDKEYSWYVRWWNEADEVSISVGNPLIMCRYQIGAQLLILKLLLSITLSKLF